MSTIPSEETAAAPLIRPLRPEDWDAVRSIYREGMDTGLATFESVCPGWEDWDLSHLPVCRLAAELHGRVAGWAALSPVSARRVYAGVAEVSIYIAADCRRRGLGRALLNALVAESEARGFWTLQSCVMANNQASLELHRSCGFRPVGLRERIGRDPRGVWRDTVLLERRSAVVGME